MRTSIRQHGFTVWLSANDTYDWAHKAGAVWPCSALSDKRLMAAFDSNGLCDLTINGRNGDYDGNEVSAIIADYMRHKLPKNHVCYLIVVGQFD